VAARIPGAEADVSGPGARFAPGGFLSGLIAHSQLGEPWKTGPQNDEAASDNAQECDYPNSFALFGFGHRHVLLQTGIGGILGLGLQDDNTSALPVSASNHAKV
jgi:hypothetical protein